jgi:serine/threonine protein kinase
MNHQSNFNTRDVREKDESYMSGATTGSYDDDENDDDDDDSSSWESSSNGTATGSRDSYIHTKPCTDDLQERRTNNITPTMSSSSTDSENITIHDNEIEVDPIIDHAPSSSSSSSSPYHNNYAYSYTTTASTIVSSIAAKVLRRRFGNVGDGRTVTDDHHTHHYKAVQPIRRNVSNYYHTSRLKKQSPTFFLLQHCWNESMSNRINSTGNKRPCSAGSNGDNRFHKKRRLHHCNVISTCLLCISITIWFVVLIWNYSNNNVYSDIQQHRPDLPVHERTRLRTRNHSHRNRNRHWIVQFGHYINSILFGTPISSSAAASTSYLPSNMIPPFNTSTIKRDSEDLPPNCKRPEWHTYNYPTCNDIYEIDLPDIIRQSPRIYDSFIQNNKNDGNSNSTLSDQYKSSVSKIPIGYIAQGLWRSVMAVNPRATMTEPVVLKTMRRTHELSHRNYERHRRDAIVMEQLTSSPYVMNIYGFCGNSVITEYMETTLEDVILDNGRAHNDDDVENTIMIDSKSTPITSTMKVQWALDMVRGVQAIHEIHGGPIVHADIQSKQFLISPKTGIVKINDFNRCRFMASKNVTKTTINDLTENASSNLTRTSNASSNLTRTSNASTTEITKNIPCKFRIPSSPGTSRSPEEYNELELDEKIDVYSVGHILYSILTSHEPWDGYHTVAVQTRIKDGRIPILDRIQYNITALYDLPISIQNRYINITKRAYAYNPIERSTASEISKELESILNAINNK